MYVSPYLSQAQSKTPKEYTNRARDEINRKLKLGIPTASKNLKYGPSPLKNVASSASDTSLSKINSNDSIESQYPESQQPAVSRKHSKLFGSLGRLKQIAIHGNNSQNSIRKDEESSDQDMNSDVMMDDDNSLETESFNELNVNNLQPLHPVPTISSEYSNQSYASTQPSIQSSLYTTSNSIFTHQNSLATQFTNVSEPPLPTNDAQNYPSNSLIQSTKQAVITLQEALPLTFSDMYAPELLIDSNLLIDGRPMFTKRELLDWDLNDIRSLLIVEKLRAEWNGQIPLIYTPQGFKIEYLPLDADDQKIIQTLVESDIYKEAKFDDAFRIQTAKYTLYAARSRHAQILKNSGIPAFYNNKLSKPEWRNVIENFLLNLAVEAQCKYDFKKSCHELKKSKREEMLAASSSTLNSAPAPAPNSGYPRNNSLLRKAIYNDVTQSAMAKKTNIIPDKQAAQHVKITKEEKAILWTQVQARVYKRLGLDWTPDKITT